MALIVSYIVTIFICAWAVGSLIKSGKHSERIESLEYQLSHLRGCLALLDMREKEMSRTIIYLSNRVESDDFEEVIQ